MARPQACKPVLGFPDQTRSCEIRFGDKNGLEPEHAHSLAVEHARTSHMNGCNRVAWVKKSPTMTPFDLRFGLAFLDHVPTFLGRYWPKKIKHQAPHARPSKHEGP
jgi:hypothetical protein